MHQPAGNALWTLEDRATGRVAAKAGLAFWKSTVRDEGSVREVWRTALFHQG